MDMHEKRASNYWRPVMRSAALLYSKRVHSTLVLMHRAWGLSDGSFADQSNDDTTKRRSATQPAGMFPKPFSHKVLTAL
jgi:hypothetical protein